MTPQAAEAQTPAPPDPASRDGALGGAIAGGAAALLTVALAARWPPSLLANVLGPPPLPAALAVAAGALLMGAGALVGRRLERRRGVTPRRRTAHAALAFAIASGASIMAPVAAIVVADNGPARLLFPFSLVGIGLSVCLVLLPWGALPILAAAVIVEGWTRTPRGAGLGAPARRRSRCIAATMAGAAIALLAAAWL